MSDSFFERVVGQPLKEFSRLGHDQRAAWMRTKIGDLNFFFDEGRPLAERAAPPRTLELAQSLAHALTRDGGSAANTGVTERIVTDALLRAEAGRDQNVYFGSLFTRVLTRATPDLIFQPLSHTECACVLRWAREHSVPVALRGAASTAMGGSVPNDGGLALDLSRLDDIDIEAAAGVCVIGAGARLRTIHAKLAQRGLALKAYPSNLGGTLAGWFVTGGIGMNAFGRGRALDAVRAADVLLPGGEHVRFHDDGRLDVPGEGGHRHTLTVADASAWFVARGLSPMTLADFAGSEGVLGVVLHLTVAVEKRAAIGAFLLAFEHREEALAAAAWAGREGARRPANLKYFSASHLDHVREAWKDDDAHAWRAHPGELSSAAQLPWTCIAGPEEFGVAIAHDLGHATAYLFVDFLDLDDARVFADSLAECPGRPHVLGAESVRVAAERFRPMQTKRFGPGLLASEILLPTDEVARFLPRAEKLARAAGIELDTEVYFLSDGWALAIAGYLTDHRRGSFAVDLMVAPALLDLATHECRARPYVLGRWQSPYFKRKFTSEAAQRLTQMKRALDPDAIVNRGVLTGLRLRGFLGRVVTAAFVPGIELLRLHLEMSALQGTAVLARRVGAAFPGPAHGRGEPAGALAPPSARALHCVNCGECNSVCPIFHESAIRLPQMLTHAAEAMHAGEGVSTTAGTLLDLCMRCGNCEEVCQAGIPHLPIYDKMQRTANAARPPRRDRHETVLATLRSSNRYLRDFLDVRPGGYQKRAPAALAGVDRFIVLRAENDAGPAATCIHCGACVAVCPTEANLALEGDDARSIVTDQHRCIGCGTCVEVCPANHANGGQTLRVMEAPTRDWFVAVDEFFAQAGGPKRGGVKKSDALAADPHVLEGTEAAVSGASAATASAASDDHTAAAGEPA